MLFAFLILNILAYVYALGFENTVYVPRKSQPNGGQQWYNGGCHDPLIRPAASLESHRQISYTFSGNTLHGRTNCPYGKQYINGQCRNVWRSGDPTHPYALEFGNTIHVPQTCLGGQQWINGGCHDPLLEPAIFPESHKHPYALEFISKGNTIHVPQTCLGGQQWINGGCHDPLLEPAIFPESHKKITDIFSANILHGRTNGPYGKHYINGQCRDIRGSGDLAHPYALEFGNTIHVPQTCLGGQQWMNGGCHYPLLEPAIFPKSYKKISDISSANTLHVRTNCPGSKHYINGQCRDVWRSADLVIFPYALWFENTVNMLKTCSGGRQWYNGGCRDPLLKPATSSESLSRHPYALRFGNTVNVPPNGSGGQQWNNGGCRDFLLKLATCVEPHSRHPYALRFGNTVNEPPNYSGGQQWINGGCRDSLLKLAMSPESHSKYLYALGLRNTLSVPPNCSDDEKWGNEACQHVSLRAVTSPESYRNFLLLQQQKQLWDAYVMKIQQAKNELEEKAKVVGHNSLIHINLPNQCPFGFRIDALGICRPI